MQKFKCREFDEKRGKLGRIERTTEDWEEIEEVNEEWAAGIFADKLYEDSAGEIGLKFSVEVMNERGEVSVFDIEVEFDPVCHVTERH